MSSNRHRSHQGGTTPTTEPKDSPGVAQFSVSEVAQFSVSLDNPSQQPRGDSWHGQSGVWKGAAPPGAELRSPYRLGRGDRRHRP